jgi:hypothetical protein
MFTTELDVGVLYNQSNITVIYVNEGSGLPEPILCGVTPTSSGYNKVLELNWRRNTTVPILTGQSHSIAQISDSMQELHVNNVTEKDEGWYICEYNVPLTNQKDMKTVQILVNVDCRWSEWSSCFAKSACGAGTRNRLADNSKRRHRGKECEGSPEEYCYLPPCPPTTIDSDRVRDVDEGGSLQLKCEAHITLPSLENGEQTITFQWTKYEGEGNDTLVSNSSNLTAIGHKNASQSNLFYGTLQLDPVSRSDDGSYKCQVINVFGTSNLSRNSVRVNVKFAAGNVDLHFPRVAINQRSVELKCTADGDPVPKYRWLKDGRNISTNATLSIESVSYDDAGVYVCVAVNTIHAGQRSANASATMKVEGHPENCSILNAASYNGSSILLTVTCFDGNSPITGYRLNFRKSSSPEWTTVKQNNSLSEVLLSGLEAFTQYQVQVKAGNRHGFENGSDAFSMVKEVKTAEGESGPPQAVTISELAAQYVVIHWEPPTRSNGNIRFYYVYNRQTDERTRRQTDERETVRTVKFNESSLMITMLKPSTTYQVQVAAVNVRGIDNKTLIGQRSDVLTFKTNQTLTTSAASSQFPEGGIAGIAIAVAVLVILLILILVLRRRQRQQKEGSRPAAVKRHDSDELPLSELGSRDISRGILESIEMLGITVYEGTTALLPSDVVGDPEPKVRWSKNKKTLPGNDPRILVVGDGALQIGNVQTSDAGIYICFAGNEMGADERKVQLVVKRQHSQPRNPKTADDFSENPKQQLNSGLHAIATSDFADYVVAMHENRNAGFEDEFQSLEKVVIELPATAFQQNNSANRYKNIPTYDHSRVVLPNMPGQADSQSDYIAAAFVDGYRKPKKYIAAQGPMEHTSSDFWRMIWSEEIPTVVMLTAVVERAKVCIRLFSRTFVIRAFRSNVINTGPERTVVLPHMAEFSPLN